MQSKDYTQFYRKVSSSFWGTPTGKKLLFWGNRLISLVFYLIYPSILIFLIVRSLERFHSPTLCLSTVAPYLLIPALGFALLSLLRHWINWNRPYEDWEIQPLLHAGKSGHSMPSRHIFSAVLISMCALTLYPPLGIPLLILSAALAYLRVIGGIHYPKDVIVGYLSGIFVGVLLFFFP